MNMELITIPKKRLKLLKIKPKEFKILLQWLEDGKNYNGIYIRNIGK